MNNLDCFHLIPTEAFDRSAPIVAQHVGEVLKLILYALEKERWIKTSDYCTYYSISRSTVLNLRDKFKRHKAIRGIGKSVRYDKFYDVYKNEWILPEFILPKTT